jgi:hypothetical protein
LYASDNQSQ